MACHSFRVLSLDRHCVLGHLGLMEVWCLYPEWHPCVAAGQVASHLGRGVHSCQRVAANSVDCSGGGAEMAAGGVLLRSDNQAVVAAHSSWIAALIHLLRCLFFLEAHFEFDHRVKYVVGVANTAADALSHDQLPTFCSLVPQAEQNPTAIPKPLFELLGGSRGSDHIGRTCGETFCRRFSFPNI